MRRMLATGLLMVALLFVGTPVARGSCGGRESAAPDSIQRMRHAVRCRLNVIRSTRGLPRLHGNRRLAAAATRHSRAMARQQFFAHDSPGGDTMVSRVRAVGYLPRYGSWALGENLAWGPEGGSSPRSIVRAWMASPAHRANIVSPQFRDIGIGIAIGTPFGGPGAVYTTDFGRRR
jgi:uncharacterized protein YkwD